MQPTRRSYSKSFKAQVIQECAQPGASIASIALSHSLNANLVHKWIRVQVQKSTALQPAFIPLPMQTTYAIHKPHLPYGRGMKSIIRVGYMLHLSSY
ncbi:transposase, partial [Pseudomonas sp. GM21]|uniref:transposase n=1 Tax=Pseudomonas sp. GM21 TaxID=1144325 RepID=UPI0002726B38